MDTLSKRLQQLCKQQGIQLDQDHCSDELMVFRNVPVDSGRYSKPVTNLCVVRNPDTRKYVVWVDRDLHSRDADVSGEFLLTGSIKDNWQLVYHAAGFESAESAVIDALDQLAPTRERPRVASRPATASRPASSAPRAALAGKVLPAVGEWLDVSARRPPLRHRESLLELASTLVRRGPNTVVLAGPPGCGLTRCAEEVLIRSLGKRSARIVKVDCRLISTEMMYPENNDERMRRLLADCFAVPDAWHLFDNVQWPLQHGFLVQNAFSSALEGGLRMICTFQLDVARRARLMPTLAARFHWIEVPPLEVRELTEILTERAAGLAAERGLVVEAGAISLALQESSRLPGANPGACVALLETALALGDDGSRIGPDEVLAARDTFVIDDRDNS